MITVVGTFLWYKDKFLIIQRHPNKPQGGTWGLPAGKVDMGENDADAAIRELFEETNIQVGTVKYLSEVEYAHEGQAPVLFRSFETYIEQEPDVHVSDKEIVGFQWVTAQECFDLPNTILGFKEVLHACKYI